MITVSYTDTVLSLEKAQKEIERKLKAMVRGFVEEMVTIVIDKTPIGNFESLETEEGAYYSLYVSRQKKHQIEITPGYHQGSWKISFNGTLGGIDPTIYENEETIGYARQDMRSASFVLGDDFYLMSNGPGIGFLENGGSWQAPNGIVQPTMSEVMATYKINLENYYNRG